ncbi:cytochrome b561 domain-containing protein [Acrasis kona]|uniref:Cytochrome b561 domain-containing protein n=1 Tax=Acrasis kona TaxID=1008807 RepID=A0AAW2ZAG1_9EUKA
MLKETGLPPAQTSTPSDKGFQKESIAAAIARLLAFTSTLSVVFYCFEVRWFTLHPVFMSFAFTYMISEGVLTAREMKIRPTERKQLIQNHILLQFGTLLFGGFGFLVILSNKLYYEKQHFQSWHSIMGLITIIALCIEVLLGLFIQYRWLRNVLAPILPQPSQPAAPLVGIDVQNPESTAPSAPLPIPKRTSTTAITTLLHRFLGLTILFGGITTIITGLQSDFFVNKNSTVVQIYLITILVLMAICLIIALSKSKPIKNKKSATMLPPMTNNLPLVPSPKKATTSGILSSIGTPADMLSFLPTTISPPVKDKNTLKDK